MGRFLKNGWYSAWHKINTHFIQTVSIVDVIICFYPFHPLCKENTKCRGLSLGLWSLKYTAQAMAQIMLQAEYLFLTQIYMLLS